MVSAISQDIYLAAVVTTAVGAQAIYRAAGPDFPHRFAVVACLRMPFLHRRHRGAKNAPIYLRLRRGCIRLVERRHPKSSHNRKSMRIFGGCRHVDCVCALAAHSEGNAAPQMRKTECSQATIRARQGQREPRRKTESSNKQLELICECCLLTERMSTARIAKRPRTAGSSGPLKFVVRAKGLEPSWGCPHTDLNRTRLPIPPRPQMQEVLYTSHTDVARPNFSLFSAREKAPRLEYRAPMRSLPSEHRRKSRFSSPRRSQEHSLARYCCKERSLQHLLANGTFSGIWQLVDDVHRITPTRGNRSPKRRRSKECSLRQRGIRNRSLARHRARKRSPE